MTTVKPPYVTGSGDDRAHQERTDQTPLRLSAQLLNVLMIALGIAAAYFMTIQSLKIELAAKAESDVVATLDKKLANFEVLLREGMVTREQFYEFSTAIDHRLARIEYQLQIESGENGVGKP